jgi:hypothetical protein
VPFVATSVDQLRVGDEVEANYEDGSLERGAIYRIEPCANGRDVMVHFGGRQYLDSLAWYFDPSPHFGFTRTWTVLNRDPEPEADAPRPGDRIALVRRREGVVREVGDDHVRFEDGGLYSSKEALSYPWDNWTQTIEIIERAPEPLTDAEKLAAIKALIEQDTEGDEDETTAVSCAGYKVTDSGCHVAQLAAKIADVLK